MYGFFAPVRGRSLLSVYVTAVESVPRARRGVVGELIVRLNHGITIVRLDISFESGELRAYASIPAWDSTLSLHQFHALLVTNLGTLDLFDAANPTRRRRNHDAREGRRGDATDRDPTLVTTKWSPHAMATSSFRTLNAWYVGANSHGSTLVRRRLHSTSNLVAAKHG